MRLLQKAYFVAFANSMWKIDFFTQWSFRLWSAFYPDKIRLEISDPEEAFLNCPRQPDRVYMRRHSVRIEIDGKDKSLQLTWHAEYPGILGIWDI